MPENSYRIQHGFDEGFAIGGIEDVKSTAFRNNGGVRVFSFRRFQRKRFREACAVIIGKSHAKWCAAPPVVSYWIIDDGQRILVQVSHINATAVIGK